MRRSQPVQRVGVDLGRIALSEKGSAALVGNEAEPVEIFEQGALEPGSASNAIVVFDSEEHLSAQGPGDTPDVDRVHDVAEVQVPCRGRRESGYHRPFDSRGGEVGVDRVHVRQTVRVSRDAPGETDNLRTHCATRPCDGKVSACLRRDAVIPWLHPRDPFPPVERALRHPNGLLAAGADLSPARLLDAYGRGVFPWSNAEDPLLWWSPDPRMVLFVNEFRLSRSLRRILRSGTFRVTFDTAFRDVMGWCAAPRADREGTWITPEMLEAYSRLATLGHAHSVEVWSDRELVGGLYGVAIGRMFYGESMFSRRSNASKVGVACLVRQFERWGFVMIDCQMSTAHLASLGARGVARSDFLKRMRVLTSQPPVPAPWTPDTDLMEV